MTGERDYKWWWVMFSNGAGHERTEIIPLADIKKHIDDVKNGVYDWILDERN